MPINKIVATKRGKAAIAAALIAATAGGWRSLKDNSPTVHPPAVVLATNTLIKPWEGLVLKAHWDPFAKIYDICYGKTRINGKPVTANMSFTKAQCDAFLEEDVYADYYLPLAKKIPGFASFPVSVQGAQISGAYNFGVGGMVGSKAAALAAEGVAPADSAAKAEAKVDEARKKKDDVNAASLAKLAASFRTQAAAKYRAACEAQTAWNKAGGSRQPIPGLVKRREMGDAQRNGEAETCVSGL